MKKPEQCLDELIVRYPALSVIKNDIKKAYEMISETFLNGGTLFVCGNGGSASDAEHIVGELMKEFVLKRKASDDFIKKMFSKFGEDGEFIASKMQKGLRTISLNGHPSLSTAFLNDAEPSLIFAQQLFVMAEKGDALLGLSTSGNSKNVLNCMKVASVMGVKTIAMTGMSGGKCIEIADCCIRAPEKETYKIQEYHLPIYHNLCIMLEERFFGNGEQR